MAFDRSHAARGMRERGFTLVELAVTLVVLSIVLAVAVPNVRDMINRNRLTGAANEIVSALQTARIEAVRRNRRVGLCPSTDGTTCADGPWSRFIVYSVDVGDDVDTPAEVIRDVDLGHYRLTFTASSNVAVGDVVWFASDGYVRAGALDTRVGALSVCSTDVPVAENTRDVRFDMSRIHVEQRNGTAECSALQD